MQLEDLRIFLQIVSAGSLSAAARMACKPKATLSHHLRRLEDELDAQLFVRSRNRLELSLTGREFVEHARSIVQACERGIDAANRTQQEVTGTVRIGSSGVLATNLTRPIVHFFAQRYPGLQVEFLVLHGEELLRARDSLDCIIYLGEPPMPQASDLTARLLARFQFGLFASHGYLQKHERIAAPADLRLHDLIAFHDGNSVQTWRLEQADHEFSIEPKGAFLSNDYWVAKYAAISDQGIAYLPIFFAELERQSGTLQRVLPNWQSGDTPLYALFASHRFLNPMLNTLLTSLSENIERVYDSIYEIHT